MAAPHRWYSVFRNLGCAAIAILGLKLLSLPLRSVSPTLCALLLSAAVCLTLAALPIAILLGIACPLRSDTPPRGWRVAFAGVFGSLGILLCVGLVVATVIIASAFADMRDQETKGEFANLSELHEDRLVKKMTPLVDTMVPPEATEIQFFGQQGGFLGFPYANCRCKVSEADFMRFAAEQEYPLATNVFRNANVEIVDGDRYPAEMTLDQIGGWLFVNDDNTAPQPKNYVSYWFGYRNCGGTILLFDLDSQTLYGSYSSN